MSVESSVNSPEAPANVTRVFVRSEICAVSAINESIFAVPSIYKSCHSLVAAPIFLVPSGSGIKLLPILANVAIPLILRFLPVTSS